MIETAPTCVEIAIQPSIGLIAEVKNTGTLNVSYLNWTNIIEWGPSYIFHRELGNGVIPFIEAKSSTSIRSFYNLIWSGVIRAIIEVKPLKVLAEKLRRLVEGHTFLQEEGINARLGVSLGVATYPAEAATKEALIRLADKRMYEDKESRRTGR